MYLLQQRDSLSRLERYDMFAAPITLKINADLQHTISGSPLDANSEQEKHI